MHSYQAENLNKTNILLRSDCDKIKKTIRSKKSARCRIPGQILHSARFPKPITTVYVYRSIFYSWRRRPISMYSKIAQRAKNSEKNQSSKYIRYLHKYVSTRTRRCGLGRHGNARNGYFYLGGRPPSFWIPTHVSMY